MSFKTKIKNGWNNTVNWFKGHKVAGTSIIAGALAVITVTTVGIVHLVKFNKEEPLPEQPPVIEIAGVNEVIKDKMEDVLVEQGTGNGNEEIFNEDNRDTAVQYVISTERNMETGVDESIATLYVTYNYETIFGEGEEAYTIMNSSTVAFRYRLTQEQVDAINGGLVGEDLTKLIEEGFATAENIEFVRNPSGREMDDDDDYTLREGIKKSLLSRTEEYVGYTENADITIISCHNDDVNCTYNLIGIISEGANTEYFKISKSYSTRAELEQIRNVDIFNVCTGQSMEDKGFTVTPKAEAASEVVVNEINGAYLTMAMGAMNSPKYVIEQADQAAEQTVEPTR